MQPKHLSATLTLLLTIALLAGCAAPAAAPTATPVPPTATPAPPTPTPIPPTAPPSPTTAPTIAATSEVQTLALAYQDAFNQRDLDTVLDLFVDDGLIYMWDGWRSANKQDMRIGLEYMVGKGVKLEITGCAPKGKALDCVLLWRDDYCLKANTGLDVGRYDLTLNSRDGKLSLFSSMRSAELNQAGAESYRKLIDWAEANRADEWRQVNAPVAYNLSGRPLGEMESQLCKAYLESQK